MCIAPCGYSKQHYFQMKWVLTDYNNFGSVSEATISHFRNGRLDLPPDKRNRIAF